MKDYLDYTKLDAEILKSITAFPGGNFSNIFAGAVAREAQKFVDKDSDKVAFQRMKELEKQGLIYQKSRQWYPGELT